MTEVRCMDQVMTPHCHAPSCIREEFWNADTNEIICNVTARYGDAKFGSLNAVFNEAQYIAIPPCIFNYGAVASWIYCCIHIWYSDRMVTVHGIELSSGTCEECTATMPFIHTSVHMSTRMFTRTSARVHQRRYGGHSVGS